MMFQNEPKLTLTIDPPWVALVAVYPEMEVWTLIGDEGGLNLTGMSDALMREFLILTQRYVYED